MRITRRQVIKLVAANGLLLSLPKVAFAAAKVTAGDGFVAATRLGDELVVASATRIDFYSAETGQATRRGVPVPAPLVLGAAAAFGDVLHVGGHMVREGPVRRARAGDWRQVMEDSGEPPESFDDFPKGRIVVRDDELIPWVATMRSTDAGLGDPITIEAWRGAVRGFTPNGDTPTVWLAECPEAATFSALAVRALRGPHGAEIADLSIASGEVDVSSVLSVSDGVTAIVASSDHGLARIWEVDGETRRELRLPDEQVARAVLQVVTVDTTYHVITNDHEDGAVRQWRRQGSRWSEVDGDGRRLVTVGGLELELPAP